MIADMGVLDPLRHSTILPELCDALFDSLPRNDQREIGAAYLRGLLETPGRKSIRRMAKNSGGRVNDQSLHHFIGGSSWRWEPVRRALAGYLTHRVTPEALVVRPMRIVKAGLHSVGVERRFDHVSGRAVNAQHAVGVWFAASGLTCPLSWDLHLPPAWLEDRDKRGRASIPSGTAEVEPVERVVDMVAEMLRSWPLPNLPTVLDAHEMEVATLLDGMSGLGVPFLARIDGGVALEVVDPALTGHSRAIMTAQEIMRVGRRIRHQLAPVHRTAADRRVVVVRVSLPSRGRDRPLAVVGIDTEGQRDLGRLWLTDMVDVAPAELLRLRGLAQRVDQDLIDIAQPVGISDYAGRSFSGWHRHITLASAAHAVVAMKAAAAGASSRDGRLDCASEPMKSVLETERQRNVWQICGDVGN
ncbi:IS701 family transposase [Nocardia halotolerans]|uniref:IS701 family transposase n=1 Tax=Nocardia halotolerans TaxID=1755878 RepID=A0ABV8VL20_9NOCA